MAFRPLSWVLYLVFTLSLAIFTAAVPLSGSDSSSSSSNTTDAAIWDLGESTEIRNLSTFPLSAQFPKCARPPKGSIVIWYNPSTEPKPGQLLGWWRSPRHLCLDISDANATIITQIRSGRFGLERKQDGWVNEIIVDVIRAGQGDGVHGDPAGAGEEGTDAYDGALRVYIPNPRETIVGSVNVQMAGWWGGVLMHEELGFIEVIKGDGGAGGGVTA